MTDKALAIAADLDELVSLWPALPAALERDQGAVEGERVAVSSDGLGVPVNTAVLAAIAALSDDVPATARWAADALQASHSDQRDVAGHLRHFLPQYDRLTALGATQEAQRLATKARQWLHAVKAALGLKVPDRKLPEHCPVHDQPLVQLVTPGDEGWIVPGPTGPTVTWRHTEAVLCRHCGTTWTPGQYLLLGRLLKDADRRRLATTEHTGNPEVPAA